MGLFGGGDVNSSSYSYSYSGQVAPQLSQQGAAPGDTLVNVSPLVEGGTIGSLSTDVKSYYAPIYLTTTGDNIGDSALANLSSLVQTQQAPPQNGQAQTATSLINALFAGNNIYYILGGLVLLLLAHHKG